ncbi:SLC45 family MFS transporter [Sandaracinobacter neustonicus]|uniref:SLC45 family MFS transporter n=2 Tax=Sandaracinobacter neustonicus TaxID=1715348 RepID=A0A501XLU3_9SPHN|nr:SLC45 family MFS transporter [Sandaracinobacter neustonicus]
MASAAGRVERPRLSFWGLWNLSFGFFGIQVGFALQNANVSRIFQSLGTSIDDLAFLWIAGPVTGLLVQPIIGYFSDRTWTPLGRRRPYFLAGAILASLALLGMPNSHALWFAAGMLWILDASLNIAMEPFRAFVGDMVSERQRTAGYAFQTVFIGAGAVAASLAPAVLTQLFGVSNVAPPGEIPPSVRLAFYIGAGALLASVLWTVFSTREYSPEQMRAFEGEQAEISHDEPLAVPLNGFWWVTFGAIVVICVSQFGLDKPVYILGGALLAYGGLQELTRRHALAGKRGGPVTRIVSDLVQMPPTMKRLALVQFFTWIALFILWIYTTPIVTRYMFGATDTASRSYNDGADWVGVLFGIYNGVAAIYAFALPSLAARIGRVRTHVLGLLAGAFGFGLFLLIRDPLWLILPMILIGIAWASILTMPYAILSSALPQAKLGVFMGLFNMFIVLPQLLVSSAMGSIMGLAFPNEPIWLMGIASLVLLIAAAAMRGLDHQSDSLR